MPATSGRPGRSRHDGFHAGDDEQAKATAPQLLTSLGFRPIDAGGLRMARSREEMGFLNITLNVRAHGGGRGPAGRSIGKETCVMTVSPVRLNHAVLFVADLPRAERFYTEVFGMVVAARLPRANAAFLRLHRSGNHHDLGLFGVGPAAAPKQRGGIGLYHLAWQVDTIDELAAARKTLVDAGACTGESSHGATKSVYGADPDGNEFEIMWMLPREVWGEYENAAPVEHLDLAAEVARWSGVRTAGRIVHDVPGEAVA